MAFEPRLTDLLRSARQSEAALFGRPSRYVLRSVPVLQTALRVAEPPREIVDRIPPLAGNPQCHGLRSFATLIRSPDTNVGEVFAYDAKQRAECSIGCSPEGASVPQEGWDRSRREPIGAAAPPRLGDIPKKFSRLLVMVAGTFRAFDRNNIRNDKHELQTIITKRTSVGTITMNRPTTETCSRSRVPRNPRLHKCHPARDPTREIVLTAPATGSSASAAAGSF